MKYLRTLLNTLRKKTPLTLGRWNLPSCQQQINRKIELANEDHCGPCGEYALQKRVEYPAAKPPNTSTST